MFQAYRSVQNMHKDLKKVDVQHVMKDKHCKKLGDDFNSGFISKQDGLLFHKNVGFSFVYKEIIPFM